MSIYEQYDQLANRASAEDRVHLKRIALAGKMEVGKADAKPPRAAPSQRTTFQLALLRLISEASEAFGARVVSTGFDRLSVYDAAVRLEAPPEILAETFEDALRAAREWERAGDAHPEVRNITLALEEVKRQVVDGGPPLLDLTQLAWLDDLLWFTFLHDLRLYPTSRELAFLLSLRTKYPPVARARDLARASQRFATYQAVVRSVSATFHDLNKADHELGRSPSDFHIALAETLLHYARKFRESTRRDPDNLPTAALSETPPLPLPIVFTTNYDTLIERALERVLKAEVQRNPEATWGYHVVFPVFASQAATTPAKTEWVALTRKYDSDEISPWANRPDLHCVTEDIEKVFAAGNILGPVVVKLHGSPTDKCPTPRSLPGKGTMFTHAVVVAESHFLAATEGFMPQWVVDQLLSGTGQRDTVLTFIAHSVSDWNIRMGLYRAAHRLLQANQEKFGGGVEVLAINRRFDDERSFSLGTLAMNIQEATLSEVAEALRDGVREAREGR